MKRSKRRFSAYSPFTRRGTRHVLPLPEVLRHFANTHLLLRHHNARALLQQFVLKILGKLTTDMEALNAKVHFVEKLLPATPILIEVRVRACDGVCALTSRLKPRFSFVAGVLRTADAVVSAARLHFPPPVGVSRAQVLPPKGRRGAVPAGDCQARLLHPRILRYAAVCDDSTHHTHTPRNTHVDLSCIFAFSCLLQASSW